LSISMLLIIIMPII